MKFVFFTLFPNLFPGSLGVSVPGKFMEEGGFEIDTINIRDFGVTGHKSVDDYPFGGGAGMVLRADVLSCAIEFAIKKHNIVSVPIVVMSAKGMVFNQSIANEVASNFNTLFIVCGRFEGIDQRVIDYYNMTELSIGNFVLFGGDIAAMAMCEAVIRLLPNACGNSQSIQDESFSVANQGLVEHSQYTRPQSWNNIHVPEVLTCGHHAKIKEWKRRNSLTNTVKATQSFNFNVIKEFNYSPS